MTKKHITVAVDGPAAAGKSTIAKRIAETLGFTYIDTGAMYRAFTYYVISRGIDPEDEAASVKVIGEVVIDLLPDGTVLLNDLDVTKVIREHLVSQNVSYIASYKDIRLALVEQQRRLANNKSVVMDGRDIGTYVLPNADVKIFLVANVHERAIRRHEENIEKGIPSILEHIEKDLIRRDQIDSGRDFAPLKQAPDAYFLDSSDLTIEEVVQVALEVIANKTGVKAV